MQCAHSRSAAPGSGRCRGGTTPAAPVCCCCPGLQGTEGSAWVPAWHHRSQLLPSPWLSTAVVKNKCYFSGAHKRSSDGTQLRRMENAVSFYRPTEQSPSSRSG